MDLERIDVVPTLPPRRAGSHKGDYGTVLVIAGGRGMAGAAALVGEGALRSGAGRVRIACPREVQPVVASFDPCYMVYPVSQDDRGRIDFPACREDLESLVEGATALAVGPGLGQSEGLRLLVRWLLESVSVPLVLDADGLNNLVGQTELLDALKRPVVLTPHPGEFGRLAGKTTAEVQAERETLAAGFAGREHLVVLLKGTGTVVTDGRRLFVNTTGNPGMATGGAGDVLTGVIAALVGQGLPASRPRNSGPTSTAWRATSRATKTARSA